MERAVETKEGKEGKGKLEECEEGKSVKDPEVQDEDTRKEEGIGNGSKESRTMGESHEVPRNAAIHRSAEEIEQNRQEAIMKRHQRISQKEKEIKPK